MKAANKLTSLSLDVIECLMAMNAGKGKWTLDMEDGSSWVLSVVHKHPKKKVVQP